MQKYGNFSVFLQQIFDNRKNKQLYAEETIFSGVVTVNYFVNGYGTINNFQYDW